MLNRLLLFLGLLGSYCGFSQEFGGNPASQKWEIINIPRAKIIYPAGNDSAAIRISNLLNRINYLTDSSIGSKRKTVGIVLQYATTVANGYVALAPFRSEFMMTPPVSAFDVGGLAWPDQLALHEYRHVEQYSNFNRGGAKLFRILLGEQGQALANALTVPDWFFEGDAVYQESILSEHGRGRLPSFFNGYRSLWDAGLNYSFLKLRNGSLKHYVPNHYEFGYLLVAYGREKYGPAFWKNVTENAAAMNGVFYPFQKSVKRNSSLSFTSFVNKALEESRGRLNGQHQIVKNRPPAVVNEENPSLTDNGERLFLKSTYKAVPAYYLEKGQSLSKIRTRDISLDNYFSFANGQVVYASYRPNTRWGWVDYSELQLLNIKTRKQKRISFKSRYFTPALSISADSIVAVNIPEKGHQCLHILNTDGKLLQTISNDSNYSFSHPIFWQGKVIVAAKNASGNMNLLLVNPANGIYTALLPWTGNVLGYPSGRGDTIYFSMAYQGKDCSVALDMPNKQAFLLIDTTEVLHTGIYQPKIYGNGLASTRFTAAGFKFNFTSGNNLKWQAINIPDTNTFRKFQSPSLESVFNATANPSNGSVYNGHRYRKTTRLFNFHSWQPYYEDPEFSFTVLGQNVLNTFQSELYFLYNNNEGFKKIGFNGIFGGFFPYLKGGLNYTFERRGIYNNKTIYWDQLETTLGFAVPLNLSKGRSLSYLQFGSDLGYNQEYFKEPEKSALGDRSYFSLNNELRFTHQVQQARQEFNPRWAQTLRLQFRNTLSNYNSWQLMATSNFYFPGFFRTHSFVVNLAAQQRDTTNGISFTNDFPFARGYANENFQKMVKWGLNYQLPLIYPDIGAWNIIYLLRIRNNFFYDQATVKDPKYWPDQQQAEFRSVGSELFFDTKWWNQLPISFGIRYSRLLDEDIFGGTGNNRWQFILPVNLFPGGFNSKRQLAF
ncbi:hypothetical protein [Flavihumibacter profundi]|jgi:hypothetical protein|uniref:hypothetical protein n=1 Tax=Flavihumibacter profundi TaxID=2716883 RepID=UPI001CC52718|nr:hypothetical protein [Flavihumibacter profundi]MBZ5856358.1 hypothetical protein [Flavihumibacter profundi]